MSFSGLRGFGQPPVSQSADSSPGHHKIPLGRDLFP